MIVTQDILNANIATLAINNNFVYGLPLEQNVALMYYLNSYFFTKYNNNSRKFLEFSLIEMF